jgi:serine/threonine-protein phosphatase 6 regulatory ankyrin repeat subunit B
MELHIAMGFGTDEDIQRLLAEGSDVNVADFRGWYPLHRAVEKNNAKLTKLFLESGAKLENRLAPNHCMGYNTECTALSIAVQNSNLDLVKLLIDNGADVNSKDSSGWTPLHTLLVPSTYYETFGMNVANVKKDLSNQDLEIFRLLVAKGADVNSITKEAFRGFSASSTPVHMAARCGNHNALELLLHNGAVADKADADGKTPMMFAEESGNPTCTNLLLNAGCSSGNPGNAGAGDVISTTT